ncbi:MAG: hypothetical protein JWL69_344 [Phycisphaerales bacterium]|jgi:three-Cys-motif partner protein|nr:hypothetical protein [Phycisphaerales bacterium]
MPRDRWLELCRIYAAEDGLPTRKVGAWTENKLWFWNRYIEITTTAMVGHPKWPAGLVYVDLFAGPGICETKVSGRRMPGSALIAANAPKAFKLVLASELGDANANALRNRLMNSPAAACAQVFQGNCNDRVHDMVKIIPPRALTLAFIDPENLRIDFSTIEALSACGRVDLLILLADRMDIVRNVDSYEKQADSVLDRMLGPGSLWRDQWRALHNRTPENICRLFADEYRNQLSRHLGYQAFGEEVMHSERGPLYRLIFASKSERGLDFWNKVTTKDRDGQIDFQF